MGFSFSSRNTAKTRTHTHGGLQGSELHAGSRGAHSTIRIARVLVCLSDPERGKKKKSVQSPVANCFREHRCVQSLCFGVSFFPRAYLLSPTSQHLKWGLQTRFEMRSRGTRLPGWSGMRDAAWEPGRAGTSSPQEATGGSCGSAQGCQSRRGGGEGGKYTVAKRRWKGKGRFYKFLNFMTLLQQCNVHSICCEVSTENMHWAY